jgi:hypothetical protein
VRRYQLIDRRAVKGSIEGGGSWRGPLLIALVSAGRDIEPPAIASRGRSGEPTLGTGARRGRRAERKR